MTDFARSLIEFRQRFGDEGGAEPSTDESVGWGRQTSVAAGTLMHHFKPPLAIWNPFLRHIPPLTATPARPLRWTPVHATAEATRQGVALSVSVAAWIAAFAITLPAILPPGS